MKPTPFKTLLTVTLTVFLTSSLFTSVAMADITIDNHILASGGKVKTGAYTLHSAIGQPIAALNTSSTNEFCKWFLVHSLPFHLFSMAALSSIYILQQYPATLKYKVYHNLATYQVQS